MMPSAPIRVLIADDQQLVRQGFAALINSEEDLKVVAEAETGSEAIDLVHASRPDVVLMDIRMPTLDGIEATRRIASDTRLRDTSVLILTTFDLDQYVYDALRAGASGFLLKDTAPQQLVNAVRVLAAGDALLAPSVTRRLITEFAARPSLEAAESALGALTEREIEVLKEVGLGQSNAEIAARLHISPLTAKTHVSRILSKLRVRNRAQLVVAAYESGLIAPGASQ